MAQTPNVSIFDTPEQLAMAAAERFVEYEYPFHGEQERFCLALAGGNTPRRVYELLASEQFAHRVEWPQVHLFFGDERCVPPDHPDSNYAMVYQALISKVSIPAKNVHRIIGEHNPREGATLYEDQLRAFFAGASWPGFDLVLLGMGEDGHTASLFPGSDALNERSKWVVTAKAPASAQDRITLTVPVFNHAARVIFLVTGSGKAERLAQVLRSPGPDPLPAQAIQPIAGSLEWFVDQAAASHL
jgi:6-phosphogluconolactonase